MLTGHGGNGSLIQIDMNPDIGVPALESAGIVKRTDALTIAAAQAPVGFNEYDFHAELYTSSHVNNVGKRPHDAYSNSFESLK